MKKHLILCGLVISALLMISCNKDDDALERNSGDDFLIFGHFYGECMGEACVEVFRISDDQLMEDVDAEYGVGGDFYDGEFTIEFSKQEYEAVMDLVDFFPEPLWDEEEKVIGLPDAGDWGGIVVEYKRGDQHDYWQIDMLKSNVPETYHEFIDSVNSKIALLQP